MLEVLSQNIIPIFVVVALGFWLRRQFHLEPRALSRLVFNALSPCLVFVALVESPVEGDEVLRIAAATVLFVAAGGAAAALLARVLGFARPQTVALMLAVMFANAGNYGLTLIDLRYGTPGLSRAILVYVTNTLCVFTLGVFLASLGRAGGLRQAARRLVRVPPLYAVLAAILVFSLGIPVPEPLMTGIAVAAQGAIPLMLIVLGLNLAELTDWPSLRATLHLALPGSALRLLLGPALGLAGATLFGLTGLARATTIIESAMPTAVITTILATEFEVEPAGVTGVVLLSTLLSPLTLPVVITLLGL